MKRKFIESRHRFLTDYNFIIAAKGSAFNNAEFESTSEIYFKGLLDGTISIEDFHKYFDREKVIVSLRKLSYEMKELNKLLEGK